MPATLTTHAIEEGTFIITASFTDEDGQDVVPTTLTWTLTDTEGVVINGREDVEVTSPAASVDIVLKGDDLAIGHAPTAERILTVEGTYTGAEAGLPIKDQVKFVIDGLVAVT